MRREGYGETELGRRGERDTEIQNWEEQEERDTRGVNQEEGEGDKGRQN